MWNEIKDEFVHLKPRTPSHLEVSLKGMDEKALKIPNVQHADFSIWLRNIIIILPDVQIVKWGASSQWSFGPNSPWGSLESTTIWRRHPSLL